MCAGRVVLGAGSGDDGAGVPCGEGRCSVWIGDGGLGGDGGVEVEGNGGFGGDGVVELGGKTRGLGPLSAFEEDG